MVDIHLKKKILFNGIRILFFQVTPLVLIVLKISGVERINNLNIDSLFKLNTLIVLSIIMFFFFYSYSCTHKGEFGACGEIGRECIDERIYNFYIFFLCFFGCALPVLSLCLLSLTIHISELFSRILDYIALGGVFFCCTVFQFFLIYSKTCFADKKSDEYLELQVKDVYSIIDDGEDEKKECEKVPCNLIEVHLMLVPCKEGLCFCAVMHQ